MSAVNSTISADAVNDIYVASLSDAIISVNKIWIFYLRMKHSYSTRIQDDFNVKFPKHRVGYPVHDKEHDFVNRWTKELTAVVCDYINNFVRNPTRVHQSDLKRAIKEIIGQDMQCVFCNCTSRKQWYKY
jgi:hypothetical protein